MHQRCFLTNSMLIAQINFYFRKFDPINFSIVVKISKMLHYRLNLFFYFSLSAELPTLIKNDPTENRNTNNSAMSSSSSKRKRFQPQKQPIKLAHSIDSNDETIFDEKPNSGNGCLSSLK